MIDLNRAGSTLIEIVTHPDLRSAEEAAAAAETVQQVLRFLGVSSANMVGRCWSLTLGFESARFQSLIAKSMTVLST